MTFILLGDALVLLVQFADLVLHNRLKLSKSMQFGLGFHNLLVIAAILVVKFTLIGQVVSSHKSNLTVVDSRVLGSRIQ